jgi:hypothetical protein
MSEVKRKKTPKQVLIENKEEVAKALELLFAAGYVDRKRLYIENFFRGIAFGAGSLIGATVVIGLVVWILSLFDQIPFIGPFIDNTRETIERGSSIR